MIKFDWLEDYNQELEIPLNKQHDEYEYREIRNVFRGTEMSLLAQFLLTASALGKESLTTVISIPNETVYQKCLREIAPHYASVKGMYDLSFPNFLPFEIQFKELYANSMNKINEMYTSGSLNRIVADLFGDVHPRPHGLIHKTIDLKVRTQKISKLELDQVEEFQEVWNFLKATSNHISLIPTFWFCTDDLKNSFALRYFCTVSDNVFLYVDDPTQRVIEIEIIC